MSKELLPNFTIGDDQYRLNGNRIDIYRYEMVCYHNRDYDYEFYKSIIFKDDYDAKYLFDRFREAFKIGMQTGEHISKVHFKDKLMKAIKEYE